MEVGQLQTSQAVCFGLGENLGSEQVGGGGEPRVLPDLVYDRRQHALVSFQGRQVAMEALERFEQGPEVRGSMAYRKARCAGDGGRQVRAKDLDAWLHFVPEPLILDLLA